MIAENLKIVLATNFAFYIKVHKFHWNIMGADFAQYHQFLNDLYEEVYGAHDKIAETIRTCGVMSPGSLAEFSDLSEIEDSIEDKSNPLDMIKELAIDNEIVLMVLREAYSQAEEEDQWDISNFMAERIAAHKKHSWMLNAFLNKQTQP